MKKLALTLMVASAISLILTTLAFSQPALPNFSENSQAPLAGLALLALAGGSYAVNKLRKMRGGTPTE